MKMTRETILRESLEMAKHNLRCYSTDFSCAVPKDGKKEKYKKAFAEVKILEEWLKEFEAEKINPEDYETYYVKNWYENEEGEGEEIIGTIKALSYIHAEIIFDCKIKNGDYPKGAWLKNKAAK